MDYLEEFQEWLSDMKPPMIRKLVVEAMGSLLQIPGEDISDYRVPAGSNYGPTLSELTSNPDECMSKLNRVDVQCLDNNAADILFTISHHPDWSEDSAASAYNSTEGLLTLFMLIDDVSQQLLSTPGRKPIVADNFMVAVDGSRMSHTAFEVAASLRGHGNLVISHVADSSKDYLQDHLGPSYLEYDFKCKCEDKSIPEGKFKVVVNSKGATTRDTLIDMARSQQVQGDYLVVGAFGRKGPTIFQLGTVADWLVRSSPLTTIVVKPTSTTPGMVPPTVGEFTSATSSAAAGASVSTGIYPPPKIVVHAPATFVVAVDGSSCAETAVHTAFRLMKPQDLLKVLHVTADDVGEVSSSDIADKYQVVTDFGRKKNNTKS
jgi:nucleotide-binding universal stress UspA family protein